MTYDDFRAVLRLTPRDWRLICDKIRTAHDQCPIVAVAAQMGGHYGLFEWREAARYMWLDEATAALIINAADLRMVYTSETTPPESATRRRELLADCGLSEVTS